MTPLEADARTNRLAWLILSTLLLVGLDYAVRPAPSPAAIAAAPVPHVVTTTNSDLGELEIPGQYAANHSGDQK